MGTPQFAAVSLEKLVATGHEIVGVVTQPDKPRGRGMQLTPSEVKSVAIRYQLPVWQPAKVSDAEFLQCFADLNPDLVIVVAFGQKIPAPILFNPKYGCINVHGSLLPQYRGAAPIQWSILNGDRETGITTMYMDEGWDTGDIIYQESTAIDPNENFGQLYVRLAEMGGDLLVKTVNDIACGRNPRIPQDNQKATLAPKLSSDLQKMDWTLAAETLHNRVRVFAPAPGVETFCQGERLKILETRVTNDQRLAAPGEIIAVQKNCGILVGTGERSLLITRVQPLGKKAMAATDYANGKRLKPGMFFGETV